MFITFGRFLTFFSHMGKKFRCLGYKTFFMLISNENEISTAHKNYNAEPASTLLSDVLIILLINVKMPTIVGILTFMSRINFILN